MSQVPSKGHCPLKTNNHASGVDTYSSKQANDHFAKGTSSNVCRISKMRVRRKESTTQKSLVEATRKGSKALVESIDRIQLVNLQIEEQQKITQHEIL
jgi:hypothetical protein